MTTTPVKAPQAAREPRKFTVAEYFRMAEAGVLKEGERVELIEGEILVMPPMGYPHCSGIMRCNRVFSSMAGSRFAVLVQSPLPLDACSAPEPDLALLEFRADDYAGGFPTLPQVYLVVEVAESSLAYDREVKSRLYGRAGIPETWVLNLPEDCIERFTEPGPGGYARHTVLRRGDRVAPVSLPDMELAVADLLLPAAPLQKQPE